MDCNYDVPYAQLVVRFAHALVAGDFNQAYALMSSELRTALSPDRLREAFNRMVEYGDGAPNDVALIATMEQWQRPKQQLTDLGWAYGAIAGDGYSEVVTVIVKDAGGGPAIRHLEWGRP